MKFGKNANRYILPLFRRLRREFFGNGQMSFSQCGEDVIVMHLLGVLGIKNVSYLDVGAHHPQYLSNTFAFYVKGNRGVCVEPDPSLFQEFLVQRSKDINLNCGVGATSSEADFYVMSTSTLNTFSQDEAERYQSHGTHQIIQTIKMKLRTINDIIDSQFSACPNFVSLDVEGLDYVILKSMDFKKFRPEVFCLETLSFSEDKTERKLTEIIDFMHANGYLTYADTYINTIFVDREKWESRK